MPGQADCYVSWDQQRQILGRLLAGGLRVAMQYSPLNAVPYVSRVDAGTIELIRSYGVEVVSSADLIQTFEAAGRIVNCESHQFAAAALRRIVDQTFSHVHEAIAQGRVSLNMDVQQFILGSYTRGRDDHVECTDRRGKCPQCRSPLWSPRGGFGAGQRAMLCS